ELTVPRSPTISRAMDAYVVSEVTTFTGLTARGGPSWRASSSARNESMSVDLVFVWSDGPDRLKGDLSRGVGAGELRPGVLPSQEHPLALPQRERRAELSGDQNSHSI